LFPVVFMDIIWHEEVIILKLIIASEYFDVESFYQRPLSSPNLSLMKGEKGFLRIGEEFDGILWTTQKFEFRLSNPLYKGNI
ncbi:MAG: hypothetical protein AAFY41_10875, partial [Bacteroidota bacterium]